jgi:hypothetical protein
MTSQPIASAEADVAERSVWLAVWVVAVLMAGPFKV